jgi:hypothetical protein
MATRRQINPWQPVKQVSQKDYLIRVTLFNINIYGPISRLESRNQASWSKNFSRSLSNY